MINKRIASSDASLPKGNRRSRGLREEPESGTVLGTTLRSMQQPMRRISWAASLCLPLPVDNYLSIDVKNKDMSLDGSWSQIQLEMPSD